jgi:hypothetical protein
MMSEPFGTTPLPISIDIDSPATFTPLQVHYDSSSSLVQQPQQPVQQDLASFVAERADFAIYGGSVIAVNQKFVVYAVKNGLIRILSRQSGMKALIRLHQNEIVSDMQFFQDGEILATVSATPSSGTTGTTPFSSKLAIWRVYQLASEIKVDPMLEIRSDCIRLVRVIWHPHNPNQFLLIHQQSDQYDTTGLNMATLVETTKVATKMDPTVNHPVVEFTSSASLQDGCIVLQYNVNDNVDCMNPFHSNDSSNLQDLAWSGVDTSCVLVAYQNGDLIFYNLNSYTKQISAVDGTSNVNVPTILHKISQQNLALPITRVLFLPHYDAITYNKVAANNNNNPYTSCFVTGGDGDNSTLTLWSAFTRESLPFKIQVVQIASSNSRSYVLNTCYGPAPATGTAPSCFITACCREQGLVYAFHCKAMWSHPDQKPLLIGSDYVVPFVTKFPILSCTITCALSTDISEEVLSEQGSVNFDMKLFAYQTAAVQCLTLTSYMCLPPTNMYSDTTPGVTVTRAPTLAVEATNGTSMHSSGGIGVASDGFEEYDVDETEYFDYDDAPDPSLLPIPSNISATLPATSTTSTLPNNNNTSNPFANWLGALAATTTKPPETPVVHDNSKNLTPTPVSASQQDVTSLLSPMEILGLIPVTSVVNKSSSRPTNPSTIIEKEEIGKNIVADNKAEAPTTLSYENHSQNHQATITTNGSGLDHTSLVKEIRAVVQEEIQSTLVPSIRRDLEDMLQPLAESITPLQSDLDEIKKQQLFNASSKVNELEGLTTAVNTALDEGIRTMFVECMRTVLIPTIESVTSQIFAKVSEKLDAAIVEKNDDNIKFDSISRQLGVMSTLIVELTKEVNVLRNELNNNSTSTVSTTLSTAAALSTNPVVDPYDQQRSEILQNIKNRNFESAFRRAVSNKTVDMALFCCQSVDIHEIFGDTQPLVSQPILLCLMQQLGTVLDTLQDPQLVLDWLQEITVSLYPPVDPQIQPHLPIVLQTLVANLTKRMERTNNDTALRRSLQKLHSLLRGLKL